MGFRFRKSKKIGPFRVTLSKSGLGASVGVKGFRVTKTAGGRVRTTASIPGTGVSYVKESGVKPSRSAPARKVDGQSAPRRPQPKGSAFAAFCVFALLFAVGFVFYAADKLTAPAPPVKSVSISYASTPSPVPTLEPTPTPTPEPTPKISIYVANKNTGKFHESSCSSVLDIKDQNKAVYQTTRDDMISMGFEPCARCKP